MTAVVAPHPRSRARARRALIAIEAPRSITSPAVWVGMALAGWFSYNATSTAFAGGGYQAVMASMAVVAAGLFVVGVQAGGRDHTIGGPVAPEAALDAGERALGRLLGVWPAVTTAFLYAVAVFVIQRVEGGMWIADSPLGRTDAVFSLVEMLQPIVLFLLAATAGVALGRATAHRTLISVVGALAIAVSGALYWAWQWKPMIWVTLIQTQPIEIALGPQFIRSNAPTDWLLSAPDRYESDWGRLMVHDAMAAWHLVFLGGLTIAFAGLAVRGRSGRRAIVIGVGLALVGVIAQAIVTPTGLQGT